MNEADLAALVLVSLFCYRGYRRGLITVGVGLTGGLLAFGLAALLTPSLAPLLVARLPDSFSPSGFIARGVLLAALTIGLRFLLGKALRELAAALRSLVAHVPPLAVLDRLLGGLATAALGAFLALALVVAALALPSDTGMHSLAARSWLAGAPVAHPRQTIDQIRSLVERLFARAAAAVPVGA